MKNKILIVIGAILIISALIFGLRINKVVAPKEIEQTPAATTTTVTTSSPTSTTSEIKTTISHTVWTIFQNYLTFAKTHNLAGLKSLSYQLSTTCTDSTKTSDCNALMDSAYFFGKDMKEKDFVNIWFDDKQIILSTNFTRQDVGTTTAGYVRGIIYFVRDAGGNSKVLYFSPTDGVAVNKSKIAPDQLEARLLDMVKDSDKDGLPDLVETCAGYAVEANCPNKITDPNKRDTNVNGWWDGVESYFKK